MSKECPEKSILLLPQTCSQSLRPSGNKLALLLAVFIVLFVMIQYKVTKSYRGLGIQQHLWELCSLKHKGRNVKEVLSKLLDRCKKV